MRFPENARVCFVGDSITHHGGYVSRIAAYYHEHCPRKNIRFYNCGISGAATVTTLAAFDLDVAVYAPTHAVVMIGVNDSGREKLTGVRTPELYERLEVAFERYKKNLDEICRRLESLGAEILLCTPVPVDEYSGFSYPTLPGAYALMFAYAQHVRTYALEHGYDLCDTFSYFTRCMWQGETLYNDDRIHPNELGHFRIAEYILASEGISLGEYAPIPERIAEWHDAVYRYRNILSGENMFVGRFDLPAEESMEIVRQRLSRGGLEEIYTYTGGVYLEIKPRQYELRAEIDSMMERLANT